MRDGDPISRTLARISRVVPRAAARAHFVLNRVSSNLAASAWPEMAFRFSSLTNTGFPVEFAWSSRDPSLRFTCEVAPAEIPDESRLPKALKVLADLDVEGFHAAHDLQKAQIGAPLSFGAWVGVRCSETDDAYKLYVEMPLGPANDAWVHSILDTAAIPSRGPGLVWRMAGLDAEGSIELYARASNLDVITLRTLALKLDAEPTAFLVPLQRLVRQDALPTASGVSFAFDACGAFAGFTLFVFAKHLYASDSCARVALLAQGKAYGLDTVLYEALCEGEEDGRWRHGMIGLGLQRGGAVWLQAGIRPT